MARPKSVQHARALRKRSTLAESKVWALLRTRPAGMKFRRQHPIGFFIADFACPAAKLVVELDGGSHAEAHQARQDERRTAILEAEGWTVLRFWNPQNKDELDGVVEAIIRHAENLQRRSPLT